MPKTEAEKAANERWRKKNLDKSRGYTRTYRQKYPERLPEIHRRADLKRKYGLTAGQYMELLDQQKGRCAICDVAPNGVNLAVDHVHATGKIRGLLCSSCNNGLGRFRESASLLRRALAYVEKA